MKLDVLTQEMISAMKSHDKIRKDALSSVVSAVKKAAIDKRCKENIPETLVDEVLLKELKTLKEMIDTCPDSRQDLLAEYKAKYDVIDEFAPQIITDPKGIQEIIVSSGIEVNKQNRGKIMGILKGRADMRVANAVLQEMLS